MTVIGDGIDPVVIVCQLRKFFYADIITVGPAKEPEKKIEPKKEEGLGWIRSSVIYNNFSFKICVW
jgi:hypothetical protein